MSISQKNVNPSLGKETESRVSDSRQEKKMPLESKEYQIGKRIKIIIKIRASAQKLKVAIKFNTNTR